MLRVLIAETDPAYQSAALDCVLNYDKDAIVDVAPTAAMALDLLQITHYDMIICDFQCSERFLQKDIKEFGDLKLDYNNNIVTLSEKEVLLTPIETKFIFYLGRKGKATFQELAKKVWGYDEPDMNSMRVLVSKINKKIHCIENVRNWGYQMRA